MPYEPYIGEITLVAYNFAPRGYAFCDGQILPISQNTALFSLIGTTYGGNGQTTFALPDLRGRVPVESGQGPGLSNISVGEVGGHETVTLTQAQLPAHSHSIAATNGAASSTRPSNRFLAGGGAYADASDGSSMNAGVVRNAGGGQPFDNRAPYLGMRYVIALQGIYPSRN